VRWFKAPAAVTSYEIYITDKITQWQSTSSKSVPGSDSTTVISGLTPGKSYYVRMKAQNSLGMSPNVSKTYCAASIGSKKCLIIDGFNRYGGTGSYAYPYHYFTAMYGMALQNSGITYECLSNNAITDPSYLLEFNYVIWFVGDESSADESFTSLEQTYIQNYLKQGGALLVSGSEIAYDLDFKGSFNDKTFFNNFLKARYIADNPTPNVPAATGVSGSFLGNYGTVNFGQVYPEDLPDVIDTVNGSTPVLEYNASEKAAIAFSGMFPSGVLPGKLLYYSFPLETIGDTAKRNQLIALSVLFFDGITGVRQEGTLPDSFSAEAFPNPFNNVSNAVINLTAKKRVTVRLYDITGGLLADLLDRDLEAGRHIIPLNLSGYSSGTYLLRVSAANENKNIKLVLIK
jgi:hypothetical protein